MKFKCVGDVASVSLSGEQFNKDAKGHITIKRDLTLAEINELSSHGVVPAGVVVEEVEEKKESKKEENKIAPEGADKKDEKKA